MFGGGGSSSSRNSTGHYVWWDGVGGSLSVIEDTELHKKEAESESMSVV